MRLPTLLILILASGCVRAGGGRHSQVRSGQVRSEQAPPPLVLAGSAYEAAGQLQLPPPEPRELPGLHNVFTLSENIISGGEPEDRAALVELAGLGIKTILTVDGKTPDVEGAAALGMRYVHVPIQYSGITEDELLRMAKTFRELEAPFYVHCYHGKHRGPAAAAIGRVLLDGLSREQAIAEMRQWCSTSEAYEGLYGTVAKAQLPTAEQSAAFDFDFDAAQAADGVRGQMVRVARNWDQLKHSKRRAWAPDPGHPDLNPSQEALQLELVFAACLEFQADPADDFAGDPRFTKWLEAARDGSRDLAQALKGAAGATDEGWKEAANVAYGQLKSSCADCHGAYRN
jgi:hypothetical protein